MKFPNVNLAIAPIAWSNDDMPELGAHISFEQCIHEMSVAGFRGCEVGHKFPRDPATLKAALAPHNLQVASAWYSLYFTEPGREQETVTGFIAHMNFLKSMGAKIIVVCECGHSVQAKNVSVFENKPIFNERQWQALLTGLEQIGHLAKENDMIIAYHPHMGTGIQQVDEIDRLMLETKPEFVSLLLDTGHLRFAGFDPLPTLQKHGKRIKHVHLKDIRKEVLEHVQLYQLSFLDAVKAGVFTVPGDGCIDFMPLFKELHTQSYQGWWVVEAEQDPEIANPLVCATQARDFLLMTAGI